MRPSFMLPNRNLITTEPQGGGYGCCFDGRTVIQDIETAAITRIVIEHAAYITSITVHYSGNPHTIKHGGSSLGARAEVALEAGEFITTIEGSGFPTDGYVSKLSFMSNKGRKWGPYGSYSGTEPFTWDAKALVSGDLAPYMGLLYFSGSSESEIGHLQATFADYRGSNSHPSAVRYEEQVDGDLSSLTPLSKYARSIMSPAITLTVGEKPIEFYANEDVLCRLPFFHAALKGGFREAANKQVAMPEDEPEIVAALIEFLSLGSYTYTYRPGKATVKGLNTPACDLKEGLFHARVYAMASKYGCQLLVDAALRSLKYSLKQLEGIEVVKLLSATYGLGYSSALWEEDGEMAEFKRKLPTTLKQLHLTDGEEIKSILSEYPALARDLLWLSVSLI